MVRSQTCSIIKKVYQEGFSIPKLKFDPIKYDRKKIGVDEFNCSLMRMDFKFAAIFADNEKNRSHFSGSVCNLVSEVLDLVPDLAFSS